MNIAEPNARSLPFTLIKGLIVGIIATEALDLISTYLYNLESEVTREEENSVRGDLSAYEKGVDQLSRAFGVPLQKKDLQVWGWRFHKAFGYTGGVQYMMLREKIPGIAKANGLLFGAAFFALFDEIAVPALGWTPWGDKFSWQPHARGAVSHLVYGVAAETTAKVLDLAPQLRNVA